MTSQNIRSLVDSALQNLNLSPSDYTVEHPADETHGDWSTNVAMVLFGQLKKQGMDTYPSPLALAQAIVDQIHDPSFMSVTAVTPGFINFSLSQPQLINLFNDSVDNFSLVNPQNQNKTVIVEYSSPNIAKPFTVGHLRSTIIGAAIANIKQATGWTVLRDNHLGDWGTQFGKLIYAVKKNWIPFDQIEAADNPVKLLVDLYVKFHQQAEADPALEDEARDWFKKLEQGDAEARQIWQKCIDWSFKEFDRIYQLLNISFSAEFNQGRGLGESFFEGKMQPVVDQLTASGRLVTGELGAKVVDFGDKYPPLMILKKDGATLYATRDLATDLYRKNTYHPDLIINEVGSEQSLYFKQLFQLEADLGWFELNQRVHVGHGMYRFADGKMSTRKGNVIWLEEVITKAVDKAQTFLESDNPELAHQIGIGALKWNDLKAEAKRDIVFDWDEILSMKGNSGPYVQYTHARANSVVAKAGSTQPQLNSDLSLNPEELSLLKWLLRFKEALDQADLNLDPSLIANYIYELCQRFNTFYHRHSILNTPHRLTLSQATAHTIKTGLELLGIAAPTRM